MRFGAGAVATDAGLANAYSLAGYFGVMPPREAFPLSVNEASPALALDPGSSEALVARGMAGLFYERNWDRARADFELALELSPNSSLAHWAYTLYRMVLDPGASVASALQAASLNPLSLPIMNLVAFACLERGMFAEALRMDEEMNSLDPGFAAAHWNRGVIHMLRGQLDEALENLGRSVELFGGMPSTLAVQAHAYAKSGDESSALAVQAELLDHRESRQRGYVSPVLVAHVYEGLGRTEDALDWLETAIMERDGWLVQVNTFPRFESLRDEPRFRDIKALLGRPETGRGQTRGEP